MLIFLKQTVEAKKYSFDRGPKFPEAGGSSIENRASGFAKLERYQTLLLFFPLTAKVIALPAFLSATVPYNHNSHKTSRVFNRLCIMQAWAINWLVNHWMFKCVKADQLII